MVSFSHVFSPVLVLDLAKKAPYSSDEPVLGLHTMDNLGKIKILIGSLCIFRHFATSNPLQNK